MFLKTWIEKIRTALESPLCLHCSKPSDQESPFCKSCQARLGIRPPEITANSSHGRIHTATTLNPTVKRLVYGYKFYGRSFEAQLAGILIQAWHGWSATETARIPPEQVLVVPVPPHTGRPALVDRFAARFARRLGYAYQADMLEWAREIEPQHRILERKARFANMAQGFRIRKQPGPYRRIIIVDDISTTGATLMAAMSAVRPLALSDEPARDREIIGLAVMRVPSVSATRRPPP